MELFTTTEVEFSYFDILADSDVREGLKTFGEWPTYPQVGFYCAKTLFVKSDN